MKWRIVFYIIVGLAIATIFFTCIGFMVYDYRAEDSTSSILEDNSIKNL